MTGTDTIETTPAPKRRLRWWAWTLIVIGALLVLAVAAFVIWGLTPLGPEPKALSLMESGRGVKVTETSYGWDFAPASDEPSAGVVFYPGGHVDARSYSQYARDLAAKGYLVSITKMPLSLAVLRPKAAADVLAAHPEVKTWVIAGHSLGGAMATTFAEDNQDSIDGIVLMAAYPAGDDLSDNEQQAVDLLGTNDTVVDRAAWEASLPHMPRDTIVWDIQGGNHAGFGDYGPQPGDSPATITNYEQIDVTVAQTIRLLERLGAR